MLHAVCTLLGHYFNIILGLEFWIYWFEYCKMRLNALGHPGSSGIWVIFSGKLNSKVALAKHYSCFLVDNSSTATLKSSATQMCFRGSLWGKQWHLCSMNFNFSTVFQNSRKDTFMRHLNVHVFYRMTHYYACALGCTTWSRKRKSFFAFPTGWATLTKQLKIHYTDQNVSF